MGRLLSNTRSYRCSTRLTSPPRGLEVHTLDRDRLRATSARDLIDSAGQLAAVMSATHAALLEILAVIDERQLWRSDGCCSLQDWVSFRFGVARKTAHEWTDAARALAELPHLSEAFSSGDLSWDKTRAAVALATPESDGAVTTEARTADVAQLDRAARKARAVSVQEADERHRARFFSMRRSIAMGGVRLSGFLPDVDGETLIKAIERLADDVPKDPDTGLYPRFDERCADALVHLASGFLSSEQPAHGERAMVVTHVDVTVPTDRRAETESGMVLASETAERLLCDAVVEPVVHGSEGTTVGDRHRFPPAGMRRQLLHRDVMCRFPGCSRMRLIHAHHIVRWPDGPTRPDNLVMLCRHHHRLMHEGSWTMRGDPEGTVEFVKPNGDVLASHVPELRDEVKQRILGPVLPDG